jgi:hypothetical protein
MAPYPPQATDNQFTVLAGQLAAQIPGLQQAVPAQLTPAQPSPAIQSPVSSTSNAKEDPKKRNFKHHCSKIVVNRLSTYFNNGQISSKVVEM